MLIFGFIGLVFLAVLDSPQIVTMTPIPTTYAPTRLIVSCRKNCLPVSHYSNYQISTLVEVHCVENCEGVTEEDYEWTLEYLSDDSFKFSYAENSRFGRKGSKFLIEKNSLIPGTYSIEVKVQSAADKFGTANIKIEYVNPPNVKNCKIIPNKGDSLSTDFKISCDQIPPEEPNVYEIYAREIDDPRNEVLIIDGQYPDVQNSSFKLPPSENRIFIIRVMKEDHPFAEIQVDANVTSTFVDKSPEEILNTLTEIFRGEEIGESLEDLLVNEDVKVRHEAFQALQVMIAEIAPQEGKDEELDEFVENLKYTLLERMLKIPIDDLNDVLKFSETVTELQTIGETRKFDPLLVKYSTTICKRLADKALELLHKEEDLYNVEEKSKQIVVSMNECVEVISKLDHNTIKSIETNTSTEAPFFNLPVITENYPNYVDHDDEYYKNIELLEESNFNMIFTRARATELKAKTTVVGEGILLDKSDATETLVFKDICSLTTDQKIQTQSLTLVMPEDLTRDGHICEILMTVWENDIFWWRSSKTKITSDIVNIELWQSPPRRLIHNFESPAQISFKMKNVEKEIFRYYFVVPKNYTAMTNNLNYHIQVHRILLPKGRMLQVQFYNVSESEVFDVVLTENDFPTVEVFAFNTTIKAGSGNILTLVNRNGRDAICYLGVLVNRESGSEEKVVSYKISSVTAGCFQWYMADSKWKSACQVGTKSTDTIIHCECTHFSLMSASLENVNSFRQILEKLICELKLISTNIIFDTLAITLMIYFLLLLLAVRKRKERIYFLADNNMDHRFAYLMVIKTGKGLNAGTTSNVTIRITGDKKSSRPYVLNYPDPRLRILQKFGNDKFLLTTEGSLGNVTKLELWLDSIGPNPSWYCKDVIIYDLQKFAYWYFPVHMSLSVIKDTPYISVDAEKPEQKYGIKVKHLRKMFSEQKPTKRGHTRYRILWLWQHERQFSYVKKLTVVLSTILATFSMALVFYGEANFELKDGFDKYVDHKFGAKDVLGAFESSFPPFLLHFGISWCFRLSPVQFSRDKQDNKLPFYCTVISWVLLMVLISLSVTFLTVYGFWIPRDNSMVWLMVSGIGIGLEIFVYEILFILIQNLVRKFDISYDIREMIDFIRRTFEAQRRYLAGEFGPELFRPHFGHLYRPLTPKQIKEIKKFLLRRYQIISELEDLAMFIVYFIILYIVILANKDSMIVKDKKVAEDIMEGKHTRTFRFSRAHTIEDIYRYVNETLIPSMHPTTWYENYSVPRPGLMIDMARMYVGVARLRQHRLAANVCEVVEAMRFLNMSCWPEFSSKYEEVKNFAHGWKPFSLHSLHDRLHEVWKYSSAKEAATPAIIGEISAYSGGGYIAYLGRSLYNSYANFRQLAKELWIRQETRVLFIEFLTYNANCNIFNNIRLIFEQSATGFVSKKINIYGVRMFLIQNEIASTVAVSFCLLMIWVTMILCKESLGLIGKIRLFYKNVWLLIDFFILLLCIGCSSLFVLRMTFLEEYLHDLEKSKHNEFLSYFYLFYIEYFLTLVAALLVCIATIRLWRFLRFANVFRQLETTLKFAAKPLACLVLLTLNILLASGLAFLLILGNYCLELASVVRVMRILFLMPLTGGKTHIQKYLPFTICTLYIIFAMVTLLIFKFVFIMIIVRAYGEARLEFSATFETYTMKDYIVERMNYLPMYLKYKYGRLGGGQNQRTMVQPKADKFMYLNSFYTTKSKLEDMNLATRIFFRHKRQSKKFVRLFDSDFKLMLEVCRSVLLKTRREYRVSVFHEGHVQGERVKLVDERRVDKIAKVVNLILQKQSPEVVKRGRKQQEKCVKMIRKNLATLKKCDLTLKLILHKLQTVEAV